MDCVRKQILEEIVCRDSKETRIRILRYQMVSVENAPQGVRERPGAPGWETIFGEQVKLIDNSNSIVSDFILNCSDLEMYGKFKHLFIPISELFEAYQNY